MAKRGFQKGVFLGNVASGFASGVKLGLDLVEKPMRTGKAQQQAEAQAARVERTVRTGANLTEPARGTPVADGGPLNAFETMQAQAKAREAAARKPRLRKPS